MSDLYHVLNRGVEKRAIFLDNSDRARFVHDMWEFNDTRISENVRRRLHMTDIVSPSLKERLVDIHGWCLMDNHYHLLLSEVTEGGISQFVRRLNVGYAKYFNTRYKRSGYVFQGRTKKVRILADGHYMHILNYIHLNPLDMLRGAQEWRDQKIKSLPDALRHLSNYRWSSYLDYCGKKNFPSILTKDLFQNEPGDYEKRLKKYLGEMDMETLGSYQLE